MKRPSSKIEGFFYGRDFTTFMSVILPRSSHRRHRVHKEKKNNYKYQHNKIIHSHNIKKLSVLRAFSAFSVLK
jgi:hypothetical protein